MINLKNLTDRTIEYLKKLIIKHRVLISVLAVAFLMNAVLTAVSNHMVNGIYDQQMAQRWSEDHAMAQISLFTTEDKAVSEDDIKRFEYTLKKKLIESGVTGDEPDEDESIDTGSFKPEIVDTIGIDEMNEDIQEEKKPKEDPVDKLFTISYNAQGIVSVTFEKKTVEDVKAIGVGGDFFLFHPMTLSSGSYFSGDDLMKDSVIIDENMAWQLFGSTDIIGQEVLIQNVPHYVVGVVTPRKGRLNEASGYTGNYIYMSYDSLSKYGTIVSGISAKSEVSETGQTAQKGGINCIEVVCPNPVQGLAARISKESLGIADDKVSVIDNTERFSFFSLFKVLRSFGTRSMQSMAIYYPYWENTARGYEDILSILLLFRLICIMICVVIIAFFIIHSYRNKRWTVRGIAKYISDKKYDLEVSYNQKKLEGSSNAGNS